MIRVGFDGRALESPAAGVRRYVRELFGAMAALGPEIAVVAVGARPGLEVPPGVGRAPGARALPGNGGWMLTGLPRAARRARLDVFHAPSYTAPFGGPRPLVLTIHDVSYARHPEWYPYRRDPLRRAFYRWSARTADRVITDSRFSRREIVAAYRLSPESIEVVPLAAAGVFTPGPGRSLSCDRPYVLHVGDLHARRNLDVAVRAVARLRRRRPDLGRVGLVLAGVDRGVAAALTAAARAAGDEGLLDLRGRTSEAELVELYRSAAALVYPSRYEGFGLPVLEAMACGTPVVAARAGSIPEVAGDAALLVEPGDEVAWAEAIEMVFDDGIAARLRRQGLAQSARFSWRRTAEATVAAYTRALHESRR